MSIITVNKRTFFLEEKFVLVIIRKAGEFVQPIDKDLFKGAYGRVRSRKGERKERRRLRARRDRKRQLEWQRAAQPA